MTHSGFFSRTTKALVLLIGSVLLITGMVVSRHQEGVMTELLLQNAKVVARTLSASALNDILVHEFGNLNKTLQDAIQGLDLRYAYILDHKGICLAHTDLNQVGQSLEIGQIPELIQKFKAGIGPEVFLNHALSDVIELVVPLKIAEINGFYGIVTLGINPEFIAMRLQTVQSIFLVIFLVAMGVAALLASVITARATRPISEIVSIAGQITEGNYQIIMSPSSYREEEQLKDSLSYMARTISAQVEEMKEKNRRLDRKVFELEMLMSASMKMNSKCYSSDVLEYILDKAIEGVHAQWGSILLADLKQNVLIPQVVRGLYDHPQTATRIALGKGIAGHVYESKTPYISNLGYQDPKFVRLDSRREGNIKNLVCVPLLVNDRAIGVINILNRRQGDFQAEDERLLVGLASLAARSIENSQLYNLAITDSMTGLFIRRYFEDRLEDFLEQGKRYHQTFSLIYTDIDFFKRINDTYGHVMGDSVIKSTARILVQEARDNIDMVARIGGEEFAILLPETDRAGAITFAHRVRRRVEEHLGQECGLSHPVTMSFGVATFPGNGQSAADLIEAADDALYVSKEGGRNRVTAA